MELWSQFQVEICSRFNSPVVPAHDEHRIGVALSTLRRLPLNALRHPPAEFSTGWFVWGGEYSDADDFFEPIHVRHLAHMLPEVVPYLALAPGWRVQLAPNDEDVWYDERLLDV